MATLKVHRPGALLSKDHVRSVLVRNSLAYKTVATLYENCLYVPHVARQGLSRALLGVRGAGGRSEARQAVLTWPVPFPPWNGPAELIAWLRASGIQVHEGGHTFYIAPQEALRRVVPAVVGFYPDESGFKILKDCRHPRDARYLYKHRYSLRLLMRLIGRPEDQLLPANYMYALGIGPRVWDLTCWESQGKRCTVFVVGHVAGTRPTSEQYESFLDHLGGLNATSRLRVLIPRWAQNSDFAPPDCSGNLIHSTALGQPQYVDFQNFGVTDVRAWGRSSIAGVPATIVEALCRDGTIDVRGRLVLDVGCTSGRTLSGVLSHGAVWAVGWCAPADRARIEESLLLSGATRYSLIDDAGCRGSMIEDDLPGHLRAGLDGAVLLWHGEGPGDESRHAWLRMPWQTLVWVGRPPGRVESDLRRALPSEPLEAVGVEPPGTCKAPVTIVRRAHG